MTAEQDAPRVVSASREIAAGTGRIFELIADPAAQPGWDGNDNLAAAVAGERVRRAGDVFTMRLTRGAIRENHVVEFVEGRRIAWTPAEPGQAPPGHLWRWELEPTGTSRTRVTHTYDWTRLTDENRLPRARATTADRLRASLDRLAAVAEAPLSPPLVRFRSRSPSSTRSPPVIGSPSASCGTSRSSPPPWKPASGQVGVAWPPANDTNPVVQDFVRCCLDNKPPA
jgi:uncharacterized protein YndB with AHSA1/START domain